jgi:Zn-dependent M28 family amino/carboxypeptidase
MHAIADGGAPKDAPRLSKSRISGHLARLVAMNGRRSASPDEAKAAVYVEAELAAAGVPPLPGKPYTHGFTFGGRDSRNVYGYLAAQREPADDVIVVGAHIDHLGAFGESVYFGAEDNASGVALVLELARALREMGEAERGRAAVLFAFFGSEEIGLVGSRRFVADPPLPLERVHLMVNVDMIGRPLVDLRELAPLKAALLIDDRRAVGVVGTEDRPRLRDAVRASCDAFRLRTFSSEDFDGPAKELVVRASRNRGDNASFEDKGIPAVFFGSGVSDDYHQLSDTLDKIDVDIMRRRGAAILDFLLKVARAGTASVR